MARPIEPPYRARAKLTDADVEAIRRRLAAGEKGLHLAREYGISVAQVSRIRNGHRRRVTGAPPRRPGRGARSDLRRT
jgi:hypothetical protein